MPSFNAPAGPPPIDGVHPNGLPFVDDRGQLRTLGVLPGRHAVTSLRAAPLASALPLVPRGQWQVFDRRATDRINGGVVDVLDQGQLSSCVAAAGSAATARSNVASGQPYTRYGPGWLYSWINNDQDAGATLEDCAAALQQHGCCPATIVDETPIYRAQMPAAAAVAALDHRPDLILACESPDEMGTALMLGMVVVYATAIGSNFGDLDGRGVAPVYANSEPNHSMHTDGLMNLAGAWHFDNVNSWSAAFGVGGRCYLPADAFGRFRTGNFAVAHVREDPTGPPLPFAVVAQHVGSRAPTATTVAMTGMPALA